MKYFPLTPICLLIFATAVSQDKQYVYYFDKDLNMADTAHAVFYGAGQTDGDRLRLMLYHMKDKHLIMIQHFMDSSLQVSDGLFNSYYADATKESEGNYSNGQQDGWWQRWDSVGHFIDSSLYEKNAVTTSIHKGYFKSGHLDSVVVSDPHTNELYETFYDDSERLVYDVHFTGDKGLEHLYRLGVLYRQDSVFTRDEIEASFPGGPIAFQNYVTRQMMKHTDKFTENDFGSCIVSFVIDTTGLTTDIIAITMIGTRLAEAAVDIVKNSPRWNPALRYGRKVKAYRRQPFTIEKPN